MKPVLFSIDRFIFDITKICFIYFGNSRISIYYKKDEKNFVNIHSNKYNDAAEELIDILEKNKINYFMAKRPNNETDSKMIFPACNFIGFFKYRQNDGCHFRMKTCDGGILHYDNEYKWDLTMHTFDDEGESDGQQSHHDCCSKKELTELKEAVKNMSLFVEKMGDYLRDSQNNTQPESKGNEVPKFEDTFTTQNFSLVSTDDFLYK